MSVSMTTPSRVLIIDSPSAPASTQALAMVTMSVTSGDSLAKTGTPGALLRRTPSTTGALDTGSQAKTRPRSSTLGQEMLTSIAVTADECRSFCASRVYSSAVPPGDRDDDAGAALLEPGQVALDELLDPRALQTDRVEHAARRLGHPRRAGVPIGAAA